MISYFFTIVATSLDYFPLLSPPLLPVRTNKMLSIHLIAPDVLYSRSNPLPYIRIVAHQFISITASEILTADLRFAPIITNPLLASPYLYCLSNTLP